MFTPEKSAEEKDDWQTTVCVFLIIGLITWGLMQSMGIL